MIPELKKNENANDHSCGVDLNLLNDDDIGTFLCFKKECITKISKNKKGYI